MEASLRLRAAVGHERRIIEEAVAALREKAHARVPRTLMGSCYTDVALKLQRYPEEL
jgi:hypothetical protein